jgi:hypothetical protein
MKNTIKNHNVSVKKIQQMKTQKLKIIPQETQRLNLDMTSNQMFV